MLVQFPERQSAKFALTVTVSVDQILSGFVLSHTNFRVFWANFETRYVPFDSREEPSKGSPLNVKRIPAKPLSLSTHYDAPFYLTPANTGKHRPLL